jgi:hypothetical protein
MYVRVLLSCQQINKDRIKEGKKDYDRKYQTTKKNDKTLRTATILQNDEGKQVFCLETYASDCTRTTLECEPANDTRK